MRPQNFARALIIAVAALVLIALLSKSSGAQSSAPQATTPSRESFDDLFRRGQETAAGISSLTARFTETTTSSLLTRPLVASGTLAVQRPSRVVMRYTEPDARVIAIDGDMMTMVWPSRNLRQLSNVGSAQNRIQKLIAGDSLAELRRQFEIDLREPSERPSAYEVRLSPKRKQARDSLTRLDLWVDRTSFLLAAIRLTFTNGDTKTLQFSDVEPNPTLEPGTFALPR